MNRRNVSLCEELPKARIISTGQNDGTIEDLKQKTKPASLANRQISGRGGMSFHFFRDAGEQQLAGGDKCAEKPEVCPHEWMMQKRSQRQSCWTGVERTY